MPLTLISVPEKARVAVASRCCASANAAASSEVTVRSERRGDANTIGASNSMINGECILETIYTQKIVIMGIKLH